MTKLRFFEYQARAAIFRKTPATREMTTDASSQSRLANNERPPLTTCQSATTPGTTQYKGELALASSARGTAARIWLTVNARVQYGALHMMRTNQATARSCKGSVKNWCDRPTNNGADAVTRQPVMLTSRLQRESRQSDL